ncbi:FprA family A-type flavoprotein [Lachnospiraceae bacterium DSM 108991]|uniref:FprA family A-type flavoprotein n=1 Tax=Claveliimonas monacensis TaxID=2779351 RepID=A0ABR9RHG6_9FIRM|nr:FprA family A-type flavoprotein [Claveliimonas monacensis]MBE5062411.1 FprA family A-type flavoprotein [Claveliimonas monacensis]
MQITRKVTDDVVWAGCNDRRLALFENLFPIPRGVSYNSYVILDEKTVLMDTVDSGMSQQFLENVAYALKGRSLDYLIVQHMEPDHCGTIVDIMRAYPQAKVVGSVKALQMIGQFYDVSVFDAGERMMAVKEGDTLTTGSHTLHFLMAPMVHWPEVMVTYDEKDKILFAADAFGTFGALNGKLFSDEVDFEREWLPDARRYYANIVGKYGVQVQALLKKAATLDIQMICPLHGPVWRKDLEWFIDKYDKWSRYEPENKAVVIVYGSIYGNTENAADALAARLTEKGVKDIKMYDVSRTHVSELISEIFRCSHVVLACSTYNGGIYPPMADLLEDMKALSVQNRTVALMENGTWAAASGRLITAKLEEMKNISLLDTKISIKSTLQNGRETELDAFAQQIVEEMQDGE